MLKMMLQRLIWACLILTIPHLVFASQVQEVTLKNGLKVLIKEDHRAPVVFTSIWYKVGGSYEHSGITGISHVMEHMMFRGTRRFPAGTLERMVSRVGGQQNAMTSNDSTIYYQVLPASKLELAFKLEADRMHNLIIDKEKFAKEIQVVMEERRMRFDNNPQALMWERFMAAAHVNNPYHHQAIGWMTDLINMTAENVRQWYQKWYTPNNAIVVVVGDVNAAHVIQLAKKYYGAVPFRKVPTLKPRREVAPLGVNVVHVYLPAKLPLLMMGYQTPTLTTAKEKWEPYALDVLSAILGGTDSSRLVSDLVRNQQIASYVSVSYDPFNLHGNLLTISAVPAAGHSVKSLKKAIVAELVQLTKQPVDKKELARIKAQIIAGRVFEKDSLRAQAFNLGTPEVVGMPWQVGENYWEKVSKITAEQVQKVAAKYLSAHRLTVGILHPQRSKR